MVRDHVAREADAVAPGLIAEAGEGVLATQVIGDAVVVERVGRRDGVLVAPPALDPLRRP